MRSKHPWSTLSLEKYIKYNMRKCVFAVLLAVISNVILAQGEGTDWFNASLTQDGIYGIAVNQAYLNNADLKLESVIVAVIDDGVDVHHKDLADKVWINNAEIPDNGIDDDKNGFVDDIYGWNFLGNSDGENIGYENLELTRLCREYGVKYKNTELASLTKDEKPEYKEYQALKENYDADLEELNIDFAEFAQLTALYSGATAYMEELIGKKDLTIEELNAYQTANTEEAQIKEFLLLAEKEGLADYLSEGGAHFEEAFNYHYNLDFDPRPMVNEKAAKEAGTAYGNNMVWAENPEHGTHVSGIIAGKRNNDFGINGVASNARIMALRAVPNGDERDVDIANAIRYAADNGARVINMSFGKSYSPDQALVKEAILYAQSKDVLMVHAAGNDGSNIDSYPNFPNGMVNKKSSFNHWLTIGASGVHADTFLVAPFSNFSKTKVDVLAPGVEILSLIPEDKTDSFSGTSMAAPVISGMAVVLRGAFPQMTAAGIKELIINSCSDEAKRKVEVGGKLTKLKKVIVHPGVPSLEKALELGTAIPKT